MTTCGKRLDIGTLQVHVTVHIGTLFCSELSSCILVYGYPSDHQATGGKIMNLHTCRKKTQPSAVSSKTTLPNSLTSCLGLRPIWKLIMNKRQHTSKGQLNNSKIILNSNVNIR